MQGYNLIVCLVTGEEPKVTFFTSKEEGFKAKKASAIYVHVEPVSS